MRLIDADALTGQMKDRLRCCNNGSVGEACFLVIVDLIKNAPTIAPPPNDPLTPEGGYSHEIVHCKDCVNLYFKDFSAFCSHRVSACRPEGFCEYGERRKPEAGS